MDKRAICAVFEQATHQVRQQIMVLAHRRVNAAAIKVLTLGHLVQCFAHAMQTLKLITRQDRQISNQTQYRTHCVRIVGGKLRVDSVVHTQQTFGIGNVGHIRKCLARVHRELRQAQNLRSFDFRIPIRAFDQAHHDVAIVLFCQGVQMLEHLRCAWIVALHHHAQTTPVGQFIIHH